MKSVRFRNYSDPHFPTFSLNANQDDSQYGQFFTQWLFTFSCQCFHFSQCFSVFCCICCICMISGMLIDGAISVIRNLRIGSRWLDPISRKANTCLKILPVICEVFSLLDATYLQNLPSLLLVSSDLVVLLFDLCHATKLRRKWTICLN